MFVRFRHIPRQIVRNGKVVQKNPPDTIPTNDKRRPGKGVKIPLLRAMKNFMIKINGQAVFDDLMIPAAGYINTPPHAESLTWGGNVGRVIAENGKYARLEAVHYESQLNDQTFETHPWLIQKFVSINIKGHLYKLGKGKDAYTVLLRRGDELWIEKSALEYFPALPFKVAPRLWGGLKVREEPNVNSATLYALPKDVPIEVIAYHPRGSQVWGAVRGGGYICLYYPAYVELMPFTSKQTTNWKMETAPPPL